MRANNIKLSCLLHCWRLVHDINFLFVFPIESCIRVGADLKYHRIARANVTNYFIRRATCICRFISREPDNCVHHITTKLFYFLFATFNTSNFFFHRCDTTMKRDILSVPMMINEMCQSAEKRSVNYKTAVSTTFLYIAFS